MSCCSCVCRPAWREWFICTGLGLALSWVLIPFPVSWGQGGRSLSGGRQENPGSILADLACLPTSPADEIWLVSSRKHNPCCPVVAELDCARFVGGEFTPQPVADLFTVHRADPLKKTVMYVHGNRTNLCWSLARGLQVFHRLFECGGEREPVRYVIWSWPSDPQWRRAREYRENSWRSMSEGNVLAAFWEALDPHQAVSVIGYSFGVQAVVSGLEHTAETGAGSASRFDVVAIAPALQRPWICVDNPFAGAGELPDQLVKLDNSRDRALRFHRVAVQHLPAGCSRLGIVAAIPEPDYVAFDVGEEVGRQHNILRYLQPETVRAIVRETVLDAAPAAGTVDDSSPALAK